MKYTKTARLKERQVTQRLLVPPTLSGIHKYSKMVNVTLKWYDASVTKVNSEVQCQYTTKRSVSAHF